MTIKVNETITAADHLSMWYDPNGTWSFLSVDDPTGVITVPAGASSIYQVGMRIKFVNGGNTIYGIITAVTNTTLTFLHQIDPTDGLALYLMANSAITANYASSAKIPPNFTTDPINWTVYSSDSTDDSGSLTIDTWANTGSNSLTIPIGAWHIDYMSHCVVTGAAAYLYSCLSTANNSCSDVNTKDVATFDTAGHRYSLKRNDIDLLLALKTIYYLNYLASANCTLGIWGTYIPTRIKATCAYL